MERGLIRLFALVGLGVLLMGASYTITNTFTNGTTADADEVNANFSAAKTAIDDNDSRIDAVESIVADGNKGDITLATSGTSWTVNANSVALGTDTTGNYAGSSSEGGAATSATALAANGVNCSAGSYPLGVDASGAAESCTDATTEIAAAVNAAGGNDLTCAAGVCDVDAAVTRDAELSAYTTGTSTPTDGSTACNTGDMHLETDAFKIYFCTDGSTDKWYGVALSDTP